MFQAWGKLPLKPKSVKGRNKVEETHLLLTSSRPLLLVGVFCDPAAKRDPPQPLWSRYTLAFPCNLPIDVEMDYFSPPLGNTYWYEDAQRPGKRFWKYGNFTHRHPSPGQTAVETQHAELISSGWCVGNGVWVGWGNAGAPHNVLPL